MLIGQFVSKLTDKDRIAIPKKIREELGDSLILAKWYEKCLVLVSEEQWMTLLKSVRGEKKIVISPIRDVERFILGSAYEVTLDRQGRCIIPSLLKEYASFSEEVVFVGLGDRVEVWSRELWSELEEKAEEKASEALEHIAKNHEKSHKTT